MEHTCSYISRMWRALKQTADDYRLVDDVLEGQRRAASKLDRCEVNFRCFEAVLEFPAQFLSRLYGGDFWGVDRVGMYRPAGPVGFEVWRN